MKNALFFDLDGTLLDTLGDIRRAINEALLECGYSYSFSKQECHYLVGDGADALVHRALKDNDTPEAFLALKMLLGAADQIIQNGTHNFLALPGSHGLMQTSDGVDQHLVIIVDILIAYA